MTSSLRHYLLTEHVIGAAIVNFLLNALIAWLSFRTADSVPMWGTQSIGGDLIGTTIILPLLTTSIVTRIVRSHVRKGRVSRSDVNAGSLLERLPDGLLARGLTLGAITTVLAAPVLLAMLASAGVTEMPLRTFVLFKGTYAAVLAMMVQPIVALRAIREGALASTELDATVAVAD